MKKIKKASYILLIVSTVLFVGFEAKEIIGKDRKVPVITCPEKTCVVSVTDPESKMLKGVKAEDYKSGDISKSVDESGNVGRKERKLEYSDYTVTQFEMAGPLRVDVNNYNFDYINNIHASSSLDGDITDKIKFNFVDDKYVKGEGDYEIEFKVTDSVGNTSVLRTWIKTFDAKEDNLNI